MVRFWPESMDEGRTVLGNVTFRYRVVRSARRSRLALAVTRPGEVTIRCPERLDLAIDALLERHHDWILSAHRRALAREHGRPALEPGGWIWILGKAHPIDEGLPPGTWAEGLSASDLRQRLIDWYRPQALRYFQSRLDYWSRQLNIDFAGLRLSDAVSRWGYCRTDGWIGLSWRLYQAPDWVVDYVIVHELTHRRFPHHRPSFWHAVSTVCPQFSNAKDWLGDMGLVLIW